MENRPARGSLLIKKAPRKNRKKGHVGFGRFTGAGRFLRPIAGVLVLLTISAGFVAGYGFFVQSDCLLINDVRVEGTSILSPETVINRAGIEKGTNILAVNLSVAKRRLQADPWVANVRISRVLPSTIVINIREYTPVAIMDWKGGFLINKRREIFKRAEATDPVSVPVISGLDDEDLDAAGRVVSPILNTALDLIETASIIGRRIPGMNVRKVTADRDMGLTLYAFDTVDEVRFGFDDDKDNYLHKFMRLNHMLKQGAIGDEGCRLAAVGFECPDRIVVKASSGDSYVATQKGGGNEGTGYHRRT